MTTNDFLFMQGYGRRNNSYPRVIDLVNAIRANGGISNEVRYKKGNHQYNNLVAYIESTYKVDHKKAMDAAKYFLR